MVTYKGFPGPDNMPERNVGQVNSRDCISITAGQLLGDRTAPASAVRAESFVTELLGHEPRPQIVNLKHRPMSRGLVREAIRPADRETTLSKASLDRPP